MSGYTTFDQVQRYLPRTIDSDESTRVAAMILDASKLVDAETGLHWESAEPAAETRHFSCNGLRTLDIDAALEVTAVVLKVPDEPDETLVQDDDFYLLPGGAGATPTLPYREAIRQVRRIGAAWPTPPAYLAITGQWAMSAAVPDDVALATAMIVAGWCADAGIGVAAAGDVKSESWDGYTVSYATAEPRIIPVKAEEILDRYRREADFLVWAV